MGLFKIDILWWSFLHGILDTWGHTFRSPGLDFVKRLLQEVYRIGGLVAHTGTWIQKYAKHWPRPCKKKPTGPLVYIRTDLDSSPDQGTLPPRGSTYPVFEVAGPQNQSRHGFSGTKYLDPLHSDSTQYPRTDKRDQTSWTVRT